MKHILLPIAMLANLAMANPIIERAPELVERASTSISELATVSLLNREPAKYNPHLTNQKTPNPQFDDIPANPVPSLSPIPDPYHDLGLVFVYNMQGTHSGVRPHSPPNYLANGPATTWPGTVFFTNINTNATSFDVDSFYFGCLVVTNPLLSTACGISAAAYATGSGVNVGSKSFAFKPDSSTSATMVKANFGGVFNGLEQVALTLTSSAAAVNSTILVIDDIKYVVHV